MSKRDRHHAAPVRGRLHRAAEPDEEPPPAGAAPSREPEVLGPEAPGPRSRRSRLSSWVERQAAKVVRQLYEERADDLEERATRAVGSLYEERADDLEDRAVRALRRAIEAESYRIQAAIERGVAVKKREVRLSLVVLVVSSLVYLVLYLVTHLGG